MEYLGDPIAITIRSARAAAREWARYGPWPAHEDSARAESSILLDGVRADLGRVDEGAFIGAIVERRVFDKETAPRRLLVSASEAEMVARLGGSGAVVYWPNTDRQGFLDAIWAELIYHGIRETPGFRGRDAELGAIGLEIVPKVAASLAAAGAEIAELRRAVRRLERKGP